MATAAAADSRSSPFARILLPELLQRIAGFMEGNDVACSLRLVGKAFAAALPGPRYTTVRLSEPVPPAAFARKWSCSRALHGLTRLECEQLEMLTARSGSIANLRTLVRRGDLLLLSRSPDQWEPLFAAAAGAGRLELCRWLRQQGAPVTEDVVRVAAKSGELAVVQALVDTTAQRDVIRLASAAARSGRAHVADWLLGRVQPSADMGTFYVLADAAYGCSLDELQQLHGRYFGAQQQQQLLDDWELEACLAAAAGSPTPDWQEKVQWLEALGCPRSRLAVVTAAKQPDALARLQWLAGRGYALDNQAANAAAETGNAEALQYVLAQGVQLDPWRAEEHMHHACEEGHLAVAQLLHAVMGVGISNEDVEAAAERGHLPVVAWAAEQLGAQLQLTADLFCAAASSGSLPLLRWLHERGCPWDATAFTAATLAGSVEQLEWLLEHGCPWDASVFAAAAGANSEEQLEWLAEHGCPMGDDGAAYAAAACATGVQMLPCLRRLGCPFAPDGSTFTGVVLELQSSEGYAAPLLWLLDAGCPVDWEAALEAAGNYAVKVWLQQQRRQRS